MNKKLAFVASDHAGFAIKAQVVNYLRQMNIETHDLGPDTPDRVDYPDFADTVCDKLLETSSIETCGMETSNNESPSPATEVFGVLICGSGQGMSMRANKYPSIRAALCWNAESALLSREHNNANVLCLGARLIKQDTINNILQSFFTAEFQGGRHTARVKKISSPIA